MKVLVLVLLVGAVMSFNLASYSLNHSCPHDMEEQCIKDVNNAWNTCQKAAEEKGVPITFECIKYFAQMGEDCWECICWVAEVEKLPIPGCD